MRRFVRAFFIAITFLAVVLYSLACCTPYISPVNFWPITFLGLAFPIIAVLFFVLALSWFFIRWRIALLLIALFFIAGFPNLHATFALHLPTKFNYKKDKNSLRVLTWNVSGFVNNSYAGDGPGSIRRQMIDYIKTANPDVMLFQEFTNWNYPGTFSNVNTFKDSLGYKYCYSTRDSILRFSSGTMELGCAIFSKFPISDSGKKVFDKEWESVGYADVIFQNKPIRFLTSHLLSTAIHPTKEYKNGDGQYSSMSKYAISVWDRLKYYDQMHALQALQIKEEKEKSKSPVVFTGDLNSVPSSYVYHTIKGSLNDAFIVKGSKLGHTYTGLSKTLRIDFIFVHPQFKILQVTSPRLYLSDHFPVVADIQWNQQ